MNRGATQVGTDGGSPRISDPGASSGAGMWPKSRPRRPAGFCGKQQREKNPVRKEETRPRSMSVLSEKTCPNNGGNLRPR
jgi:hypothetical protein